MARQLFFYSFLLGLLVGLVLPGFPLEKVRLGTASKTGATFYPPVLAAEQKGFWKENGLEVEWVPMAGGSPVMRAAAAGALSIGLTPIENVMPAAERGVPVVMVAEYISEYPFHVWVRADTPYRQIRDIKGAKIGVTTLGGSMHAYGRVIVKAHGMENDVRFVGAGGTVEALAGLRVGTFEAMITGMAVAVKLKAGGIIREIASTADYLPKPWVHYTVFARKDYAQSKPDLVKKVIRATLEAGDFMQKNPRWTIDLMKSFQGLSEEEAKLVYKELQFNITGRIDRRGVENARRLYIEYGLLTEKAPPVDELFTNVYLPS